MARLTEKQGRFCNEYLVDFHITYAAIRSGVPAKSAACVGSKWYKMAKIQARIAELRAECSVKTGVSVERIVKEMGKIALADPADMFDEYGNLKNIKDMPQEVRAAIAGIEVIELPEKDGGGTLKKIKLVPKEKAQDMIMKHLGGYAEDNKQKTAVRLIVDIEDENENEYSSNADAADDADIL